MVEWPRGVPRGRNGHKRGRRAEEVLKGAGGKPACILVGICGRYFHNLGKTFVKVRRLIKVVIVRIPLALDFFPPGVE